MRNPIALLTRGEKVVCLLLVAFGAGCFFYGLADLLGFIKKPFEYVTSDGRHEVIPTWGSGIVEIIIGALFVYIAPDLAHEPFDKIDLLIENLRKKGKAIIFPPRDTKH